MSLLLLFQSAASGSVTGTLVKTLANVTASASGTYTPQPVTGTLAKTLANVTLSAAGTYTPQAVTGAVSVTLANVTLSAAGNYGPQAVTGTVVKTLASVSLSALGTVADVGAVAVTGAGRKRRRYEVEHDGRVYAFATQAQALAAIEAIRAEQAQTTRGTRRKKARAVAQAEVVRPALLGIARTVPELRVVVDGYVYIAPYLPTDKLREWETQALNALIAEHDDEEALIMLLEAA